MPTQRYLLVEGVRDENGSGHPVTDPNNPSASPARFAGWQYTPKMRADGNGAEEVDGLIDHYSPARQVVVDHIDLRSAIKHGHLKLHAEATAKSHDDARVTLEKRVFNTKTVAVKHRADDIGGSK